MNLMRSKLDAAIATLDLEPSLAGKIWDELARQPVHERKFDSVNILYYFGALIAIGAMGWFMRYQWASLSGGQIALISGTYAGFYAAIGATLWRGGPLTQSPGGLCIAMAVAMTPLFTYGIQQHFNIWGFDRPGQYADLHRYIRGGWFAMEVATVVVAALTLRFVKFPFLVAIIAFALWYMSMDLTPIIFETRGWAWDERKLVSMYFGLAMLSVAYVVDTRQSDDFAFWLYLFGLLAFWGGLSAMSSNSELSKFFYFLINLGLVALSAYLRRRTFLVFGGLGVFGYLGHLSHKVFPNMVMFPVALSVLGLGLVVVGIMLQRRKANLETWFTDILPAPLARARPPVR